jgi:NMD protein affecting ribosome stability and mRNA decay
MATKEFISTQKGKCPQCGDYGALFFDDDGELLCSDCIFENETSILDDDDDDEMYMDDYRLF